MNVFDKLMNLFMMHLQMNHFDRNLSRVEIKHESLRFSYIESPEFGQWNGT